MPTKAYAAAAADTPLAPSTIERREPMDSDVVIDIRYCGVCHSDIHQARDEWNNTLYPCVPGHEIIGTVAAVGSSVTRHAVGETVGVGCLVDSCRTCDHCERGLEQFCRAMPVFTYNGPDAHSGGHTFGGYSERIVVDEAFVLRVPERLDAASAGPLLCAGITTYSPLRKWNVGPGQKVGIVGLGGLGHMGVKFARSFGARVVLFTTSPGKAEDGLRLGAHEVVISKNEDEMAAHAGTFDFILDTVSADHDVNAYLSQLKLDGTLCLVGVPENPLAVSAFSMILPRRNFSGSLIGGITETQEMLDYCAEHGISCDVEMIGMAGINDAYERILKGDVKYRFVIDMDSLTRS